MTYGIKIGLKARSPLPKTLIPTLTTLMCLVSVTAFAQPIDFVSVDAAGTKSNQQSTRPDISADGRFVIFISAVQGAGGSSRWGVVVHET
jgi:hypothetical protein